VVPILLIFLKVVRLKLDWRDWWLRPCHRGDTHYRSLCKKFVPMDVTKIVGPTLGNFVHGDQWITVKPNICCMWQMMRNLSICLPGLFLVLFLRSVES